MVLGLLALFSVLGGARAYAVITDPRPEGVAVNPATKRVYVANVYGESVSVIDGSRSVLVDSIAVACPRGGIAVNPATNRVYVLSCTNDGSVVVIDGGADEIIDNIHVDWGVFGISVNPATNRIYVVNSFAEVWVIDGASHGVIARIPLYGDRFGSIAGVKVNPSMNRIHVLRTKRDGTRGAGVTVIDGSSHVIIATVRLASQEVTGVAVNPASSRVYALAAPGFVQVIDGATNRVMGRVTVEPHPVEASVNPKTGRVFISNIESDNVSVLFEGDLLRNGSFDRDTDGDGLPEGWKPGSLTGQDRLVGNPNLYDGRWALQFTETPGVAKSITQTLTIAGKAGSTLRLEGFSKADGASLIGGAYQVRAKVFFVDGTTGAFAVNFSRGTHDWQRRVSALTAAQDFNSIEVGARYDDQTGTAWFDAVHLWMRQ